MLSKEKSRLNEIFKDKFFLFLTSLKFSALIFWISEDDEKIVDFVMEFLINKNNPWEFFYLNSIDQPFIYPTGIFYILNIFLSIKFLMPWMSDFFMVVLSKVPILIADICIYVVLVRDFYKKRKFVTILYYASPIIFIAAYLNPKYDLLPLAVLMIAIHYVVNKELLKSSILFGIALGLKLPIIFSVPLILTYIWKNEGSKEVFRYTLNAIVIWFIISLPFIFNDAYINLVLNKESQNIFLDLFIQIGDLKVYVPLLFLAWIYIMFLRFEKINADLLYTFMAIIYFAFVVFLPSEPSWYAWPFVFVTIFFIKTSHIKRNLYFYSMIIGLFVLNTLFFYSEISLVLQSSLEKLGIHQHHNQTIENLVFTIFEGILLFTIWILMRYGIRSNSLYKIKTKPFVLGIGGDSGVGKTTLTGGLLKLFGQERVLIVEGDGYHKWERGHENWSEFTHLNPKANHLHEQASTLEALKNGNSTQRVEYDHNTGKFTSPQKIDPNDFIVMCGLHPLYLPKTRKAIDLKIYVDTDEKLRRHWKIIRDCAKRGYTIEKVMLQIESRIEDAQKYIYPQKNFADLVIRQYTEDKFTLGDSNASPKIKLKITCDANMELETLLDGLTKHNLKYNHDYDKNLESQYIIIDKFIDEEVIEYLSQNCIENLTEVVGVNNICWGQGYESFIQLFMLIAISEKMKEGY